MMTIKKILCLCLWLTALTGLELPFTPAARAAEDSLIPNPGMEKDADNDNWPDGWPRLTAGTTWEKEEGNRYIRMTAQEPDRMMALHRLVPIPAGVKAMEFSVRMRSTDLKSGAQPWHDGRIILNLKDQAGGTLKPGPAPVFIRGKTNGWVEKKSLFLIPEGATVLEVMPTLFQVKSGSLEIDDMVLKAVDTSVVLEAQAKAREKQPPQDPPVETAKPENWPKEIKVVGNRLHDPAGNEVWLQGVHVVSLEWNPKGEAVLASIKHAIEVWKANVIRLSVKPDYWFGKGCDPKAYQDLIDACVNMAANRGAYLLIDNHTYRAVRESDIAFWTEVATKYKNHPAVLFDIINEPHTISWDVWKNGGFVEEKKQKGDEDHFLSEEDKAKMKEGFESPGMQKMVEVIRATGAKNIVVAGGLDWAYDLSGILKGYALEDKTGNGIMYSAHIYPWKSDWQGKVLDIAAVHPIFVGEVGANNKKMDWLPLERQEDPATWVPDMLGLIQKHKLNWSAFSFHPAASPVLLQDWKFTPNPEWGQPAKDALSGKQFELKKLR